MVCTTITMHVCLSVCLFVCSLVPSIGKTESVAASSCKEVRDVLSNKCSGGRQSGTYWITVTDPYTQHNSTMRVGRKHTCLGNYKVIVGICLNRTQIRLQMGTTPLHWISACLHYRCIATWTWMEGVGPWCGSTPTWRFSPSPRPCTTSASTTGSAPTWRQDGATYQTRDTFSQHT